MLRDNKLSILIILAALAASTTPLHAQPGTEPADTQPAGAQPASGPAPAQPEAGPGAEPAPVQPAPAQPAPQPVPAIPQPAPVQNPVASAPASPQAPARHKLPPVEDEVKGTCKTPRQAYLQLLHFLQKGDNRWQPAEAAKCFNGSGLEPALVRERATMLKETLDSRGVWIKVNRLPIDPDYINDDGYSEYRDPAVVRALGSDIYLEKVGDRWLFSAETIAKIPDVYPVTGIIERYVPSWLKFTLAGVEVWKYLLLVLVYLLGRLVRLIVVTVLDRYIERLARKTKSRYLDRVVDRAEEPVGLLVMALVFYIALPALLLPIRFTDVMLLAIKGFAAYAGVWLGYRLIDVFTDYMMARAEKTESKLDDQLVPLLSKTLKVFVSVVGGIFILQNLGVNVGSLLAGLGLGGLAFALAAQDTIANFFGSIMIFIDKPFQIGDWVVIGDTEGVIEEVGFRTSRVRTFYNSLVTVPNAMVTKAVVDNYGVRQYRRYVSDLGLTYDTPPDKIEAFCEGVRAIIKGLPGMRKDFYLVEFKGFGDSALVIMLYCFMESKDWNEELRTRTTLNLEIMRFADNLGVSFAYPTQTLHVSALPNLGEEKPSHYGPTAHEDLARIIDGFGPDGKLARPRGLQLTSGYDCGTGGRGDEDGG